MKSVRLLSALLVILLLGGCRQDTAKHSVTLFAMDTVMELDVYDGEEDEALRQASALINQLEGLLSTTDEHSEIYAANHSGGAPVALSGDTEQLLELALSMCRDTAGALDVSIYPVVRTWGFTTGQYRVPDGETLASLLELVDYTRVSLNDGVLTIPDGMEIDLGAVAKGYTGDRILDLFRRSGVTSAKINLGGNLQMLGTKTDGALWRVAVQDPTGDGYAGVVEVENKAVVTSGGYERYFEENGVRYWHIIDPATGCPARSGLISVTVVADSGAVGDALSTALFVMGKERAADYWRGRGDFDFILIGEDGSVTISEGIEDSFSLYGDWTSHDLEVVRR